MLQRLPGDIVSRIDEEAGEANCFPVLYKAGVVRHITVDRDDVNSLEYTETPPMTLVKVSPELASTFVLMPRVRASVTDAISHMQDRGHDAYLTNGGNDIAIPLRKFNTFVRLFSSSVQQHGLTLRPLEGARKAYLICGQRPANRGALKKALDGDTFTVVRREATVSE